MVELKPCPFCGGTKIDIIYKSEFRRDGLIAFCYKCGAQTCLCEDRISAITAWERRARNG